MSSGSAEKQEQIHDSNSSSSNNNSSNSISNSGGGSKKAVCSEINVTEPMTDVEVIYMASFGYCFFSNFLDIFLLIRSQ